MNSAPVVIFTLYLLSIDPTHAMRRPSKGKGTKLNDEYFDQEIEVVYDHKVQLDTTLYPPLSNENDSDNLAAQNIPKTSNHGNSGNNEVDSLITAGSVGACVVVVAMAVGYAYVRHSRLTHRQNADIQTSDSSSSGPKNRIRQWEKFLTSLNTGANIHQNADTQSKADSTTTTSVEGEWEGMYDACANNLGWNQNTNAPENSTSQSNNLGDDSSKLQRPTPPPRGTSKNDVIVADNLFDQEKMIQGSKAYINALKQMKDLADSSSEASFEKGSICSHDHVRVTIDRDSKLYSGET